MVWPVERPRHERAPARGGLDFIPAPMTTRTGPSPLEIAKDRLRIPALWMLRAWPGKPGKSCKFPDGEDRSPSASIFKDGLLLRDFRADQTYDAPALLAAVESLTREAACRLFIELAGVTRADTDAAQHAPPPAPRAQAHEQRAKPHLPPLDCGTDAEHRTIAELRAVSVEAVRLASARGMLWFADSTQESTRSWIVTDRARWNAIARRLDGHRWQRLPGQPKARTLRGAWASWPIGLPESAEFPAIALCEGSPDFLAAFHFAIDQGEAEKIAPVCMGGAGLRLPAECLPAFAGKRVRIFVHDDEAGHAAFERWAGQLADAGAEVDGFDFAGLVRDDGAPVADLNDLARIGADSWDEWRGLVDACMKFAAAAPPADDPHAARLLTAAELQILRASGFQNDPLALRAVELFAARVIPDSDFTTNNTDAINTQTETVRAG